MLVARTLVRMLANGNGLKSALQAYWCIHLPEGNWVQRHAGYSYLKLVMFQLPHPAQVRGS
jgi:hypothetical protein